jgi:hypothetical protein
MDELLHLARRLRWDAGTLALMLDELRAKADAAIAAAEAARRPPIDPD